MNTAPATQSVQKMLLDLWADHVDCDQINEADNPFELGADSLAAMRVTSELRRRLDLDLPGDLVFRFPTISDLAVQLASALDGEARECVYRPAGAGRDGGLLTFAQERMWLLQQLGGDLPVGNVIVDFRVYGDIDPDALEQAVDYLVQRHEILRTTFHEEDGRVVQVAAEQDRHNGRHIIRMPNSLAADCADIWSNPLITAGITDAYNLAARPPWRAWVVQCAGHGGYRLLLFYHQVMFDAWGLRILLDELSECYRAVVESRPPYLPPVADSVSAFARRWRDWTETDQAKHRLDYWLQSLAGAPPCIDFAIARSRPAIRDGRGAVIPGDLDEELATRLRQVARRRGETVFPILLTGFVEMLHSYTGQRDMVVGVPVANRSWPGSERIVGCLVNMLPVRVSLPPRSTNRENYHAVRTALLNAHANHEVALETIVEHLKPSRVPAHAPVFQVAFGLEPPALQGLQLPDTTIKPSFVPNGTAKFDLSMMLTSTADRYEGSAEFATDLLTQSIAREMVESWTVAVHSLVAML